MTQRQAIKTVEAFSLSRNQRERTVAQTNSDTNV